MKRLVLRWIGLAVFLVLLSLVFVRLGDWQLARLDETREQNRAAAENRNQSVVEYGTVMGEPISDDEQWQRVRLTGSYTGEQYQVRYRNFEGPGIEVAAIFETTTGDAVVVDRGFIPKQQGRPDTDVLPPVPGPEVEIVGYLRRDERGRDNAITPRDFTVRLINAPALGESLGRDLLPGYVSVITSTPENGDSLQPITPAEPSEGNHFSYALQWFAFGAIALVGIAVLIRSDLKDREKARRRAERREQQEAALEESVR